MAGRFAGGWSGASVRAEAAAAAGAWGAPGRSDGGAYGAGAEPGARSKDSRITAYSRDSRGLGMNTWSRIHR